MALDLEVPESLSIGAQFVQDSDGAQSSLSLIKGGGVGIGTTAPKSGLAVDGMIDAVELVAKKRSWFNGDMTIDGLPSASEAPNATDLVLMVVDKTTGRIYKAQ